MTRIRFAASSFDADNVAETVALIRSQQPDLLLNVALPYQDLHLMDACLETGVNYLDTANYEPIDEAKFEYAWQWAYHDRFKDAGIMALPELEQINGIEKQFAINHLGHFVLINQLHDTVVAAEAGRFVILSSLAHKRAPEGGIQFDNLTGENGEYDGWTAYGQSKLANALCARELARRLSGTNATANSVHPGRVINLNRRE